jgi:hypothetical protein
MHYDEKCEEVEGGRGERWSTLIKRTNQRRSTHTHHHVISLDFIESKTQKQKRKVD